jgi:DNA primase
LNETIFTLHFFYVISQQTIQQIQSRIDIIEIIGEFIKLKKRGANYLGLCPFHGEKTPSFTVSPAKEIYKCFGCGRSGNTIGFLMEHEKYSYVEALKWLANKYNVEIEETAVSPEVKLQQQLADSLYILNGFAGNYFKEQLWHSEDGQANAMSYLKERGFTNPTIEKFQLGYCLPQRDAFAQTAIKAQYSTEYLVKSGLVVERDGNFYDNYRGRIIFPIHNNTGKIIGFGARVIGKADKAPKYINTPENEIYIKSKILYGSYFARQAIDRNDECLLVEGYTDVISLHQAGIENVVASGGTSLTIDQLRIIKKYTNNLTIVYDGDNAGIKAAKRGLDMALEEGLQVKLVLIPDNEDPDSYVNKVGADQFKEFVKENKKDIILFQLEISLKEVGTDSSKKAALVNEMAETIAKINKVEDFTRQQDYIKQCAELLRIEESGLVNLVNKFIREKVTKEEQKQQAASSNEYSEPSGFEQPVDDFEAATLLNKDELQERGLIKCLIEYGQKEWDEEQKVADYIFYEIDDTGLFENQELVQLFLQYKEWHEQGLEPNSKSFLYAENRMLSEAILKILDMKYELSPNWASHFDGKIPEKDALYKEETLSTLLYLKLRKIRKMIEENQRDLEKPHTMEELKILLETHKHLKDMETELTKTVGSVIIR